MRSFAKNFLPTFAGQKYAVGALVLKDHPALTAAVGQCIAIWSHVDHQMGMLFGILFGASSDASLEVFLTLRRAGHQVDSMKAAAKFKLETDAPAAEVLEWLLVTYSALEKERNSLAHGCFGILEDDPDALVCVAVKHNVHFNTDILNKISTGVIPADPHEMLKKHLMVYRTPDLQSLYEHMENYWWAIFYLYGYLRDPGNKELLHSARKYASMVR